MLYFCFVYTTRIWLYFLIYILIYISVNIDGLQAPLTWAGSAHGNARPPSTKRMQDSFKKTPCSVSLPSCHYGSQSCHLALHITFPPNRLPQPSLTMERQKSQIVRKTLLASKIAPWNGCIKQRKNLCSDLQHQTSKLGQPVKHK